MRSMLWGQPVRRWQDHLRPNFWDLIAFPLLFGLLTLIVVGAGGMTSVNRNEKPSAMNMRSTVRSA
jgi:uncharacterized membrane protein YhaH (DUF805 family)